MESVRENREINIIDLFFDIIAGWRCILIWMIVFAVLLGAFSYVKSSKSAEAANRRAQEKVQGRDWDAELNAINLNDEQLETAKEAYEVLESYEEWIADQETYLKESVMMQLDPMNVPSVVLLYEVDNHYEVTYPTIEIRDNVSVICDMIASEASDESLYEDMAAALSDTEKDITYYKELVTFSDLGNGSFQVAISYTDLESAKIMAEVAKEHIEAAVKTAKKTMDDFDFVLISEAQRNRVVNSFADEKQNRLKELLNLQTLVDKYEATLEASVAEYARLCIERDKEWALMEENGGELPVDEVTSEVQEMKPSVSKKYVVLGALIGAFLAACYEVLRRLFGVRLYKASELAEIYDMNVFGSFAVSKRACPNNIIDKWIVRLRNISVKQLSKDETFEVVAAHIRTIADKKQYKNIFVTGSEVTEADKVLIDQICDQAKKDGYHLSYGANLAYNPESLRCMAESDAVLFVETEKRSLYTEIEKQLALCANYGVDVMGAVVVK